MPWFTRYSASYRCAFSMTKCPFGGNVTAASEVNYARRGTLPRRSRGPMRWTNGFSSTKRQGGDVPRQIDPSRDRSESRDGRVAPYRGTTYLLWKPLIAL